jgi:hypothetical protein
VTERLTEVKLVDHRGRTLCKVRWTELLDGDARWLVQQQLSSEVMERARQRHRQGLTGDANWQAALARESEGRVAPSPVTGIEEDGRVRTRLDVPGLSVRWEKVTAALDWLADHFPGPTRELTVDELRVILDMLRGVT